MRWEAHQALGSSGADLDEDDTAPGPLQALTLTALLGCCLTIFLFLAPRDLGPGRVILDGLDNPRGLAVDSAGTLYVAETGHRPAGGRLLRLASGGRVDVLASGLPVLVHGSDEEVGAADVTPCEGSRYVVMGEGADERSSALLRLDADDSLSKVADLLAYEDRYNPDHASRESNPFAVVCDAARRRLLVADSAANDVLSVTRDGKTDVLAVWMDDPVPTGITLAPDGSLYVALFSQWPHVPGTGRVDRVDSDGAVTTLVRDLTMPIGVAVDTKGRLLVLEFSDMWEKRLLRFRPGGGRLIRVASSGAREVLLDHLNFPTAVRATPDGSLYVADSGAFAAPRAGRILRLAPGE